MYKRQANVLNIAHSYSSILPGTVNSVVATQLKAINTSLTSGTTSTKSDKNINSISWYNSNSQTTYFPFVRVDYNATEKLRMSLSWAMTYNLQPGANAAPFPGSAFNDMMAGYKTKNYTSSYAVDWSASPRLINQFKFGFLYDVQAFAYNAKPLYALSLIHILIAPIAMEEGLRFAIREGGRTVGAGVVAKILE